MPPGDAIKIDRAFEIDVLHDDARQGGRALRAARQQRHAEARFEQSEKIAVGAHLVEARHVELPHAQKIEHLRRGFAIGADHQPLLLEIVERDGRTLGESMHAVDGELKLLGEQRPGVEPLPFLADLRGEPQLDLALLEIFEHLDPGSAQQLQLESLEQFAQLDDMGRHQRRIDGARKRQPERADLAFLDGGSEQAGAERAFIALLQQRQHALAELGELGLRPLAAEQIAAKLAFELADGARERRLGDVAFLGGAREIESLAPRRGSSGPDAFPWEMRSAA